jgi:isopentenyl-diphosphate Delta-isomerase
VKHCCLTRATVPMAVEAAVNCSTSVAAENDAELFDTYDIEGNYLGTELRGICHAQGIFHRAVYCFVFNTAGQLLLQRRSSKKKIAPLKWDLSVAEHLQPGESFKVWVLFLHCLLVFTSC